MALQVRSLEVVKTPRQSRVDMQGNKMALQWFSCHFWHAPLSVSRLTHRLFFAKCCESTQTPRAIHTQLQRILLQDPALASTINRAVNQWLVDPAQLHLCHTERIQTPPFSLLADDLVEQACGCHRFRYSSYFSLVVLPSGVISRKTLASIG